MSPSCLRKYLKHSKAFEDETAEKLRSLTRAFDPATRAWQVFLQQKVDVLEVAAATL
jgi:hypothetical protein